jgi:hypothetical protein
MIRRKNIAMHLEKQFIVIVMLTENNYRKCEITVSFHVKNKCFYKEIMLEISFFP